MAWAAGCPRALRKPSARPTATCLDGTAPKEGPDRAAGFRKRPFASIMQYCRNIANAPDALLMPSDRLKGSLPLLECPRWPTMQWLLDSTLQELSRLVVASGREGFRTTKGELVSASVLACGPLDALSVTESYRRETAPIRPHGNRGTPLLLRVPSPISLRMDALIAECRKQGDRAFRYELVGGLIVAAADLDRATLEARCLTLRSARAEDAAIGNRKRDVLEKRRPSPGARRYLEPAS
jgi:hypothetical protein